MSGLILMLTAAFVFWGVLFGPFTRDVVAFWPMMVLATGLLAGGALVNGRQDLRDNFRFNLWHISIGIFSAGVLYGVFWFGHWISTAILPFAGGQVERIYDIRQGMAAWKLELVLFFWIGPAEEIFWRGYVQKQLSKKWNPFIGFVVGVALYTLVHIWSMNFMLVAAAGLCGGFWGLMYWKTKSLWPVIISHAVWDVVIFILFPIGSA